MKKNENSKENINTNSVLSFEEMMIKYKKQPKINYIWSGIKENSFGLVFGPSKSGKTVFCENLAINIAIGSKQFFGSTLNCAPQKVLFLGLEEHWVNRVERNIDQFNSLNPREQILMKENYLYQNIDFEKRIISIKNWNNLEKTIVDSKAKIVFIDSITRMNPGKLENSNDAEFIMQKLREICHNNGLTLICVHHTPKMEGYPISMDKIKGSAVFAQESDFAIGINRTTNGFRYMKNVFYRYAPDDDDTVKEFEMLDNRRLNLIDDVEENELLGRQDRRKKNQTRDLIVKYLDDNRFNIYSLQEMVEFIMSNADIKKRQAEAYLSKLCSNKKINGEKHGYYCSIHYEEKEKTKGK